jgi:hypothetical protein
VKVGRRFAFLAAVASAVAAPVPAASASVLRVGSYTGIAGQYSSIQAAIDAAKPGDWILVGPGDYKEHTGRAPAGHSDTTAGVLITTPDLDLRGMNRDATVVDGTKPGSPRCSRAKADQEFGPAAADGTAVGLNGIMIYKANDVWVQNLTVCNYLDGAGGKTGNEIWWNGGDNSGAVGGSGYLGSYLTATSTYFGDEQTAAQYGIFSSNWSGGTWEETYASNFNDSGYYIGACQQVCDQTVDHAHGEYNALGYSGSNSGGRLVVENSEFDNNEDGFDTNSQNGDNPPPQDGACPGGGISPITHTTSCWVFMDNYVHDNNNPNVPSSGSAAAGPVGTGMSVSGARDDTIMNNRFVNNDAWGVIFVPYNDNGPPCTGGTVGGIGPGSCLYDEWGDALLNNQFQNDGAYGHPSNGDFAEFNFEGNHPSNCYDGNTAAGGGPLTADSAAAQVQHPGCGGGAMTAALGSTDTLFLTEVLCDSQVELVSGVPAACPTGQYPRRTSVIMHPLPSGLATMPSPCAGVPADPWCGGQVTHVSACVAHASVRVALSLSPLERFVSVTVTATASKAKTYKEHGVRASVPVALAAHGRSVVRILERIKVGSHAETISFTRVYKRC